MRDTYINGNWLCCALCRVIVSHISNPEADLSMQEHYERSHVEDDLDNSLKEYGQE